jgi:uncharacterized YccA/Bax inhibitor family protein
MRSGNPALNQKTFQNLEAVSGEKMSISGTVNKTLISLFILIATAAWVWSNTKMGAVNPVVWLGAFAGFIVAIVTCFKQQWAPITTPIYAALEGLFIGGISAIFEMQFPGIVIQAVSLTFGTLFCLLVAYQTKLIKVTQNFRMGIVAATGAIALIYIVTIILGFFGVRIPFIHGSGWMGIGFSLFVVTIAALNLVLDFDFIERGSEMGAPKYMEWYGAFGLLVTLVWLYIEILRLLSKIYRR